MMYYNLEASVEVGMDAQVHTYTLETVPRNWYLELEVCRGMTNWEELIQNFKVTFNFEVESPLVDAVLQVIRGIFFLWKKDK
jgi:hypothetical protein